MKKNCIGLVLFVLLLIMTACTQSDEKENTLEFTDNQSLEEWIETITLPTNLLLEFDPQDIVVETEANTYYAEIVSMDEQKVVDHILQWDVITTNLYNEGKMYETRDGKDKEYLVVFADGSFGRTGSGGGGLNYSMTKNGEDHSNKLGTVILLEAGLSNNTTEYNVKSDYSSNHDLHFEPFEQAKKTVEETLEQLGFPTLQLTEAYSLDLDTMQKHYDMYKDEMEELDLGSDGYETYEFTEQDETYVFYFQQQIGNLPLVNSIWQKATPGAGEIEATTIQVLYTKDGIRDIMAANMLNIREKLEGKVLISPVVALKNVIDSYSNILLQYETKIVSMNLSYIPLLVGDNEYKIIPVWIFGVEKKEEITNAKGKQEIVELYQYIVIDAFNGKKIEKVSDVE